MSYFVGLMLGSSIDSIDAVVVDIKQDKLQLVANTEVDISLDLKKKLLAITGYASLKLVDLALVELEITQLMSEAVKKVINLANINTKEIKAIGVHGYTCMHQPKLLNSMQLVNANILAAKFSTDVVVDFRRLDIAHGGQGAPLLPAFHYHLWKNHAKVVILNIGGMANVTYWENDELFGFDTGPGNVLIDAWTRMNFNLEYDLGGGIAKKGKVIDRLLMNLKKHVFFDEKHPKSTSRDDFNIDWLLEYISEEDKACDVQATLVDLTAWSIAKSLEQNKFFEKIYVCGGGAFNFYLLERIKFYTNKKVYSVQDLGWSPVYLEAVAFAWFAYRRVKNIKTEIKSVTGAKYSSILGALYDGRH